MRCYIKHPLLLPLPQRTPTRRLQTTISGRGCPRIGLWDGDSSGSTPLLDPRFSPSSPPTVRSNRQGRGVWADMLGAGSVLRLLSRGALEVQGWVRPEVAPIPAADHRPIISCPITSTAASFPDTSTAEEEHASP
ncbi:unnamed protein product [Pleuronectes platessa]|uniref:Uncharacterized protein n=1 Tax=Pleuronectes platessa TaxID=8262 RepID=A0A9N7TQK8_PLEPL|nr:unnamed protein product [Pleuronectes platessa]